MTAEALLHDVACFTGKDDWSLGDIRHPTCLIEPHFAHSISAEIKLLKNRLVSPKSGIYLTLSLLLQKDLDGPLLPGKYGSRNAGQKH